MGNFLAPYGLETSHLHIPQCSLQTSDCAIQCFSHISFSLTLSRIQPLSEALDDLYKEFNALKSHLGELTEKFGPLETFIDELKAERASASAAPVNPVRRRIVKKPPVVS